MSSARERLGHYEILGPLGAGGMGEVYVAKDPILGRKVAVKVLPVRLSSDRETLTRFTQEARSASALNHPNIVTIHEIGAEDGVPFMVMELIDGHDLRSMIATGALPNKKTFEIASQIAEGLAAAHERGIIHRDLKPENVMLTRDGYVKILDFGLAKMIAAPAGDNDDTLELEMPGTNPGTILGTVGYMSPEQARGARIDYRSDQFTLGAILYELSTGRPAFDGETAVDVLSAILHHQPPPIRDFNTKAPEPFCWIVERLLAKDPNERYSSTRDLARELRTLRDRYASEPSSLEIPRPARMRLQRRRLAIAGGALAVLVAAGVGIWKTRDTTPPPPATAAATVAAPTKPAKNYLAVLRFKDLTGDANGQLVVDGFAETLTAQLARFSSIQVMRPQNPETLDAADALKLARDLGANLVLSGSMQREGDRLRVSYSVLDVRTGTDKRALVEGSTGDLFGVQDRVAESVAENLELKEVAQRTVVLDPAVSQRRYLEALGNLRRYDKEASVDSAIAILEELGTSASIQASLGRAYLAKFQLTHDPKWAEPARRACEAAVAADPQNPEVHVTLGELKRQTGQIEAAIAEFNVALKQQPNSPEAVLGLADAYKAAGKLAEAETQYRRAIELQPNFWGTYNRAGAFYASQGRWDKSAEMFARVVELVPDNQRGYNNLGAVYQQMGRYDDAIRVFSTSIQRGESAQAYSNLGTCYYFLGQFDRAATSFERATELSATKYIYWANLGDAYRWIPKHEQQSAVAYDRAIQLATDDLQVTQAPTVRARLAECLAKRGRLEEAASNITTAAKSEPFNLTIMYRAAVVANLRGDQPGAVRWLSSAVDKGYNKTEILRDPEFRTLRSTPLFQQTLGDRLK